MKKKTTNEPWDKTAPDLEELKDFWATLQNSSGYNNGHEWFAISGISKDKFTELVRTLKEAESAGKGFHSCEAYITEGKDNLMVFECHTAKDPGGSLMDHICEKMGFMDKEQYPVYWSDCWDYPDNCEIDPKTCHLKSLDVFSEHYLNFDDDNYENWDLRFTIVDDKTGWTTELGGGYLDHDQTESLWELSKSIPKADDYKESLDPDIGFFNNPPEEEESLE